jgi:hypothetical protein
MDYKDPSIGEIVGWIIIFAIFFAFLFFGLHLDSKGILK